MMNASGTHCVITNVQFSGTGVVPVMLDPPMHVSPGTKHAHEK